MNVPAIQQSLKFIHLKINKDNQMPTLTNYSQQSKAMVTCKTITKSKNITWQVVHVTLYK